MAKVMNVVFGIGIAVILYLVVLLGIRAFYPEPRIDDFNCSMQPYPIALGAPCTPNMTIEECNILQKTTNAESDSRSKEYESCYKRFEKVQNLYGRNVFIIAAIVGSIAIIVSFALFSMTNISAGVAFAGLSLIVYGFARGWQDTSDMIKFIIRVLAAVIVFIFAIKVNKKYQREKSQASSSVAKKTKGL
jgi:Ca2+/Na+ antiporter